jgi:invasion protein IalB
MKRTMYFLFLILGLNLGSVAFSQETATQDTPPTSDTSGANDSTFPVAETAEPVEGESYIREVMSDWEVRCIKGPDPEKENCRLYQLLKDADGNSVAEINLVDLPKGGQAAAGVTFVTPIGTLLTAQVAFRVDAGPAKRYPYSWCDRSGCFARFGLTSKEVTNLQKGAQASIVIVSVGAPDKPINLTLSLTGFTAAWKAVAPH